MTSIRVSKEGVDSVVESLHVVADELTHTAVVMQENGLGTASLSLLAGHGLPTALFAQVELLCARALSESARLRETAEVARANGESLLGADVTQTRSMDWLGMFKSGYNLGHDLNQSGPELLRAASYTVNGTWLSHASRWKAFGSMHAGFVGVGSGVAGVAGVLIPGAAGRFVSAAGGLASSAFQLGTVVRYAESSQFVRLMGGRAVAKVAAPIGFLMAGKNIFDLATTDYDNLVHGDSNQHSNTVRTALYGSKVIDTIGIVAVSGATVAALVVSAPASVPIIGAIMVGGLALSGVSALINGTVAAQDYNKEHPEVLRQALRMVQATAGSRWPPFFRPGFKELIP